MTRKRDRRTVRRPARRQIPHTAEARLQMVIANLEASDKKDDPHHWAAIKALVLDGPFAVNETFRQDLSKPHPLASLWRAEFVAFLRTLVQQTGQLVWHPLVTEGDFKFEAGILNPAIAPAHVAVLVDAKTIRDVALLHLMFRLQEVGVRNVMKCKAPDCPHLFVKSYRREYCSIRCQQRHSKQIIRARELDQREHQQQQREKRRRVIRSARR